MAGSGSAPARIGEPVRPAAGGEHAEARGRLTVRVAHAQAAALRARAEHRTARHDLPAGGAHVLGVGARDGREVDDAGGRRVQAGDPGDMGLDLAQLRLGDAAQAGHGVGRAAALELVQARQLVRGQRDDQLAVGVRGDAARLAVGVQLARAGDAQARLERARLVVDAGVDDAAVVARLVEADDGLALQHAEAAAGVAGEELARDRHADDAPADDDEVALLGRGTRGTRRARRAVVPPRTGLVCQVIHRESRGSAAIPAADGHISNGP